MKHKFLVAAAAAAFAAPALAQPSGDPIADDIVRALPPPDQIEAIAPAMDRALGALLDMDVGPVLDAADPMRRRPGYGRPGRTLGELGRRDDPWFEERLRSSIYGSTAEVGRMIGAFAAAAPALAQTARALEDAIGQAIHDYHRGRGGPPLPPPPHHEDMEDWED